MSLPLAQGLELLAARAAGDHHLAVLVTLPARRAADPQVSVVNAGVLPHPRTGATVIGLVARGGTTKLANLRANPRATLVFRDGWEWVAARGSVELAGPDDPAEGIDAERLRLLLRGIYAAAGGEHPDLAEYDRVMQAERRCAVLVTPERIWTNPTGAEHQEPEPR